MPTLLLAALSGCSSTAPSVPGDETTAATESALTSASWNTTLADTVAYSDPGLLVQAPGKKLDVVYYGSSNSLRRRTFDAQSGWSAEADLGGALIGKPSGFSYSAFRNGDGDDIRVYGRAPDNTLWEVSPAGGGFRWNYVPNSTTMASSPAAATWGLGRSDVFYVGPDHALRHIFYEGGWSGVENLGGNLVGDPSSVARNGRVDTVVRAAAGGIAHSWWDGRWNWETITADLGSDPAIASWSAGRFDVVYRSASGALKHRFTTHYTDWSPEQDLGGAIGGAPAAASWGPGHLDVMARDATNHLLRRSWDGLAATTDPAATCVPSGWSSDAVCAGPWRYARYNAPCDGQMNVTHYSCWYPDHTDAVQTSVVTVNPIVTKHTVCDDNNGKRVCQSQTDYDYFTPCTNAASAAVASKKATSGTGVTNEQRSNNCTITLKNVPVLKYGQNDAYCSGLPVDQRTATTVAVVVPVETSKCPILAQWYFSAPGLSSAAATSGDPYVVQQSGLAPTCLTDDTTNVGADPSGKFTRLSAALKVVTTRLPGSVSAPQRDVSGAYVDNVGLEAKLVERLLLLGETYGDKLTAEQRTFIMSVAAAFPELANPCAASWTPPARDASCPATPALDGTLAYCSRLLAPTTPARIADAFLEDCVAVGTALNTAYPPSSTTCGAPAYRDIERRVSREVQIKALGVPLVDDANARSASLTRDLKAMGSWFELHRASPTAAASADQRLDAGNVMAAFWKSVHGRAFGSVESIARDTTATPAAIEAAVGALQTGEFAAEKEVLLAAYAGTDTAPVIANELLLDLTADALRPMVDQLRTASKFHDFACRIDNCTPPAGSTAPPTGESEVLWNLLAATPNAQALASAASASSTAPWAPVFAAIASHHKALERAAVAPAARAYVETDLLAPDGTTTRPAPLAAILRDAATRNASFKSTGVFDPAGTASLRTGLNKEMRDAVVKAIDGRTGQASDALSTLQRQRADAVQAAVVNLQGAHDLDAAMQRLTARKLDFDLLTTNLAALRAGIEADHRSLSDFSASFGAIAKKASSTAFAIRTDTKEVTVTASDPQSRTRSSNWMDISLIAAPGKITATAGQIVNFEVKNTWSPVCAFDTSVGPDGKRIAAAGVFTGSEGFIGRLENSTYKAASYSSFYTTDHSETTSSTKCSGMSMKEGLNYADVSILPTISDSTSDCESTEDGTRWGNTDSRTTGSDHRETASFAVGIHLGDTPFPTAPAGALLAVVMPTGITARGQQLDVRVVAPHSTIVMERDSDIYFVVNDAQCALDTGALSVSVNQYVPAGASAVKLGAAMAASLADIRKLEPRARQEGRMLPEDTAAWRSAAVARLDVALPAGSFADFTAFQTLYYSWLDAELARLRRAVEVDALEHQRRLITLELATMADDLKRAQKASRYLSLAARWAVENVDSKLLSDRADALREGVTDYLLPLARIRFPKALDAFARTDHAAPIARLRSAAVSTSLAGLVKDEVVVVNLLRDSVSAAMLDIKPTEMTTDFIGLSIPNPNYTFAPLKSDFRAVDPATSAEIWQQIVNEKRFRFTLTPELIYDRLGGKAVLLCDDGVPIINGMAVYVAQTYGGDDPNDPRNVNPTNVQARFDAQASFPGVTGNLAYTFADDAWLAGGMRILYGMPQYGANVFLQQLASSRKQSGISPFARVEVNLDRVASDVSVGLNTVQEIDVLYQVESLAVGTSGLAGVDACRR